MVVDVGLVGEVIDVDVGFVGSVVDVDVDDSLVKEVDNVLAVVDDDDDDDEDVDVDVPVVDDELSPPFLSSGSTTTTEGSEDAGTGSSFEMCVVISFCIIAVM